MNIILLGPPGAGKGTQAMFICQAFNLQPIATGDMLRSAVRAGSALGREAKAVMDAGQLVSDQLIINLVKERIAHSRGHQGFLFDGFPRTLVQAQAIQATGMVMDYVIELVVADAEIIKRLSGRWVHLASGRIYHQVYHPPQHMGKDDLSGDDLIQRPDDDAQKVRARLTIYHQQMQPLMAFYQQLSQQGLTHYVRVDGLGAVEVTRQRILAVLS